VAGLATLLGLCGCVSTQTKNARTVLVNQRTLDAESSLRVTRLNPAIAVTATALIRSAGGSAVVVALRNRTDRAFSDLPISVGLRTGHDHTRYLNRDENLGYYETHVASIRPAATALWVLTFRRTMPIAARPFAEVGFAQDPASTRAHSLPELHVRPAPAGDGLRVTITNPTGIPQYGLPVYAVGTRGGRYVAAATGSIPSLNGGSSTTLALRLLGAATGAHLQLSAPATIFN
jgi:hypothetical protein